MEYKTRPRKEGECEDCKATFFMNAPYTTKRCRPCRTVHEKQRQKKVQKDLADKRRAERNK